MRDALAGLEELRELPLPDDLRQWGSDLATPDGALPLLGLGVRAAMYPGLLWNGARLSRAGATSAEAMTVVGLTCGGGSAADLVRGVVAGAAVLTSAAALAGDGMVVGVPSTDVLAAAACAALACGADRDDLPAVLDLAATLMIVTAPRSSGDVERGRWHGHCLAAGWLAPQLAVAGLVSVPDAVAHTVSTVTGRPPLALTGRDVSGAETTAGAPDVRIAELLARLW